MLWRLTTRWRRPGMLRLLLSMEREVDVVIPGHAEYLGASA
jgi:hypothetical protein